MKLNQLTFTRFLAAVAIVIFHYGMTTIPLFTVSFFRKANVGVSYFFVLSGFVMLIAYLQKGTRIDLKQYYVNRFARIYPVYIIALVITTVLLITRSGFDLIAFLLNALLVQAWIPKYATTLNYPGWSLSVEFLFYLIFPLLFNVLYIRSNLKVIAVISIVIYAVTQVLINFLAGHVFTNQLESLAVKNFLAYFPLLHVNEFLIGNLTAIIYMKKREKWCGNYDVLLCMLIGVMIAFLGLNYSTYSSDRYMSFLFASFILFLALNNGLITSFTSKNAFKILGEASYGMYILQFPVHAMVGVFFKKMHVTSPEVLFFSFLIILIVISLVCYHLFEVPARDYLREFLMKNNLYIKGEKEKLAEVIIQQEKEVKDYN